MKIAAPVTNHKEIEQLKHAGATEIYFGFMDRQWTNKYGDYDSISRRQGKANVETETELSLILDTSQKLELETALTLNTRYTEQQLEEISRIIDIYVKSGGKKIICADLTLMLFIKNHYKNIELAASLICAAGSVSAVSFYESLGVSRVILPRFVTGSDFQEISRAFPRMEFETLVFYNRCRYIDGFCRFYHGNGGSESFDTNYKGHGCEIVKEEGKPDNGYLSCGVKKAKAFHSSDKNIILKVGGRGFPARLVVNAVRLLHDSLETDVACDGLYRSIFETDCRGNCY